MQLILQAEPNTDTIQDIAPVTSPIEIPPSHVNPTCNSGPSCISISCSDKHDKGRLILLERSCDIKVLHSSNSTESLLESQVPQTADCDLIDNQFPLISPTGSDEIRNTSSSTDERTQEQGNQDHSTTDQTHNPIDASSDKHLLMESHNDFLLLSFKKLDYMHFSKLAELMNYVCDCLIKVTPDCSDKFIKIRKMLEVPIKVYNDQIEELIESVNKQVQLQYKELIDMLENLSLPQPLCIDEILKDIQFQEYFGPYSQHNLIQAIKKINRPTRTVPTPRCACTIL